LKNAFLGLLRDRAINAIGIGSRQTQRGRRAGGDAGVAVVGGGDPHATLVQVRISGEVRHERVRVEVRRHDFDLRGEDANQRIVVRGDDRHREASPQGRRYQRLAGSGLDGADDHQLVHAPPSC
jgi:hypothetical protein